MALLYDAELSPTKIDLIRNWLPRAHFGVGAAPALERVGAFRFDDPAGEVGVETHLVRGADDVIHQVPMTYRSTPLVGARLIGEMDHSVLGRRYVYDATTDPVYVQQLLVVVYGGGREAEQYIHVDDAEPRRIASTVRVRGSGAGGAEAPAVTRVSVADHGGSTIIGAGRIEVVVHHQPVDADPDGPTLVGEWDGGRGVLASVRQLDASTPW
ncbi:hypothetical protein ACFWPA_16980 [Rhodococcus sp. NPDC058505]|uniref:maltokinase N-terminal cap-like domain-containing protein n=1 Tax=unclassified Rhodococcus (in: high G+C Gram-positive bacteria) TaxID=192944 RepID=UPI00364D0233